MNIKTRQYPIGEYAAPETVSHVQRDRWMENIKSFPSEFRTVAQALNPKQINSPYREGGWTALQVIHHVADSHVNAYLRFRWAMSEDNPVIKPYDESAWAAMEDYKTLVPEVSLYFLEAIHERWYELMRHMGDEDWANTYQHPEYKRVYQLDKVLGLYVWHGQHHLAHLKLVLEEKGLQ